MASIGFSLSLSELGLRVAGIPARPFLEEIQFGWPDPKTMRDIYVRDPNLFWIPRTYQASIADARRTNPQLVFLGDSCTEFGTYPARVVDKIRHLTRDQNFHGFSAGVGGWSASQGLRQVERDIISLHPKIITAFFGWNDHWKHFGASDEDVAWVGKPLSFVPFRSKIVEAFKRAYVMLGADPKGVRVPLPDYKRILRDMVMLSRHNGITVVLMTAPTSHRIGQEPARLAERWMYELRELVPVHQKYIEKVRQVATETGTPLCDLAARFAELPAPQREREYMLDDGIHFTPAGDEALATLIVDCLRQYKLIGSVVD